MPSLILGTAQFGQVYGITNRGHRLVEHEVRAIVESALANGISSFDTAICYGDSTKLLGGSIPASQANAVKVVTKIAFTNQSDLLDSAFSEINKVRALLGLEQVYGLLLHNVEDFKRNECWQALIELKRQGLVKKIGLSVYEPKDIANCPFADCMDIVQLPVNILDRRWEEDEWQRVLPRSSQCEVHARSIFLQGLLLAEPSQWPHLFAGISRQVQRFITEVAASYQLSALELCVKYVRSLKGIDGFVVGVFSQKNLEEVIEAFNQRVFALTELEEIRRMRPAIDMDLLDPRRW